MRQVCSSFEQHVACRPDVERLERACRVEHRRDGAGRTPQIGVQGRTEPEQVGRLPCVLQQGFRPREQRFGLGPRPRDLCRPSRLEKEADSIGRSRREIGGACEVGALCCETATAAGPLGGALELSSDGLVGPEGGFGGMPRAPVGVALGIEHLSQRLMDVSTIGERGAVVDRRAHQRMAELDHRCRHDESRRFGRSEGVSGNAQQRPGSQDRRRVTDAVRGGDEQEHLRVARQGTYLP